MIRVLRTASLVVLLLGVTGTSRADFLLYAAFLSGPAEAPPNASPATGFSLVGIDTLANTMRVQANFSGLTGNVTAGHIHSATAVAGTGTAGVATPLPTFPGFPSGVTSGTYDTTFDMTLASSYNPTFVTNNGGTVDTARAALFAGIAAGKAYLNIHTSAFGGGEIRGFYTAVPEPSGIVLMGLGTLGMLAYARCRAVRTQV